MKWRAEFISRNGDYRERLKDLAAGPGFPVFPQTGKGERGIVLERACRGVSRLGVKGDQRGSQGQTIGIGRAMGEPRGWPPVIDEAECAKIGLEPLGSGMVSMSRFVVLLRRGCNAVRVSGLKSRAN